jgi:hypothetical protein
MAPRHRSRSLFLAIIGAMVTSIARELLQKTYLYSGGILPTLPDYPNDPHIFPVFPLHVIRTNRIRHFTLRRS